MTQECPACARRAAQRAEAAARIEKLSPRLREVVGLIGEGLTGGEISLRIDIAEKTVRNYTSLAFEELGVRNRVELARLAWTAGLGPSP